MGKATRISERTAPVPFADGGPDVSTPGVAKGVVICGLTSRNGRDYPADVLRTGAAKYEGVQVYIDHLDGKGKSRGVREWFGELRNVRSRPDGRPEADLHFAVEHAFAAEFANRAANFPKSLGLSHVAVCQTKRVNGRERVESIQTVESVDLVASPATNASLFESVEGVNAVELTLGQLVESQESRASGDLRKDLRRWLVEMEGDPLMDAPVTAPAEDADHGAVVDGAITSVMTAAVSAYIAGDIDEAELGKRIKTAAKAHPKLKGEKKDDAPAEDKPAEDKSESVQLRADNDRLVREAADLRVKLLAAEKGVRLTEAQHKALTRCESDGERAELLESFKAPKAPAETPKAAGRMTAAELLGNKTVTESKTTDAKAFAASIRN